MKINKLKNIIFDTKTLVPTVFVLTGAAKMYTDYQTAKPEKRKSIFIKDAVILSASAASSLGIYYLIKKVPNYELINNTVKFLSKYIKKLQDLEFIKNKITPKIAFLYKPAAATGNAVKYSLNSIERAIKDCISASLITLAAFGGGLASNSILTKFIFQKHKSYTAKENKQTNPQNTQKEKELEQKRIARYMKYVDEKIAKDSANNAFSAIIKDIPSLKMLDKPLVALAGFDIIKEKTFEDRFKRTTHELIANTLIPTFIISIASALTQTMQNFIKVPLLFIAAVGGAYAGKHVGEKVKNKFPEHLDYNEMLKNWHGLKLW